MIIQYPTIQLAVAPNGIHQLITGHQVALPLSQSLQDFIFFLGQRHLLTLPVNRAVINRNRQVANRNL